MQIKHLVNGEWVEVPQNKLAEAFDHAKAHGSAFAEDLYKFATNDQGHVVSAKSVNKLDLVDYGLLDANSVASIYREEDTYIAGEFCIYQGLLYKALVDCGPENFNPEHWEMANILIAASTGGTVVSGEADWDAEQGEAGYIKNKPYISVSDLDILANSIENDGIGYIVETRTVVIQENTIPVERWTLDGNHYVAEVGNHGTIISGNSYTVTWGGVDYDVVAAEGDGNIYLGNLSIHTPSGTNTDEPFVFIDDEDESGVMLEIPQASFGAKTYELTHVDVFYHKIDEKFALPSVSVEDDGNVLTVVNGEWINAPVQEQIRGYIPQGPILFANLPQLGADVLNNVYDVIDGFTSDSRFLDYDAAHPHTYPAHSNVAVVNIGTDENPVYKFDVFSGFVDLTDYVTSHGSVSNTTAAFNEAATRANVVSGETLSVLFGKIKKWFSDLGTAAFRNASDAPVSGGTDVLTTGGAYTVLSDVPHITKMLVTLPASGWNNYFQTITVSGVKSNELQQVIQVAPQSSSRDEYNECQVECVAQAANSLTFECDITPTSNLSVYVALTEVNA